MINRFIIQGNLTHDPEVKSSANGIDYCNFSIACNISKDKCHFLNATIFGDKAKSFCKMSKKGDMRIIEGDIVQDSYEKNGEKINKIKLVVTRFYFAGDSNSKSKNSEYDDITF